MIAEKFALVDVDDPTRILCTARDVDGFSAAAQPWRTFRMLGCTLWCQLLDDLGNSELLVLGDDGLPVRAYYLSVVILEEIQPCAEDPALLDLTVTGWLLDRTVHHESFEDHAVR